MSDKLIIRNFGPIKDISLDLRRIMIFIGPQASGKSTIAKLLAIFNNVDFLKSIDEQLEKKTDSNLFANPEHLIFRDYHVHNFFKKDTYIKYDSTTHTIVFIDGRFNLTLSPSYSRATERFKEKLLNKISANINEDGSELRTNMEDRLEKVIDDLIKILGEQEINYLKQIIIDKSFNYAGLFKKTIYIPAERFFISLASGSFINLMANNVPIAKNILNFGAEFEKARLELNEVDISFLNAKYRYEDKQDKIFLNNDLSMTLLESSSGFQALVPLMALLKWHKNDSNNLFLIEEPELNLFPNTQKNLIYYLVSSCFDKTEDSEIKSNLFITTHSPYVLTSINNLLFAYRVSQKHPSKVEEIAKIIPQDSWLNPDDFNAYFIKDGIVRNIFNEKVGMISENELDNASEEINNEFGQLMEIYKSRS